MTWVISLISVNSEKKILTNNSISGTAHYEHILEWFMCRTKWVCCSWLIFVASWKIEKESKSITKFIKIMFNSMHSWTFTLSFRQTIIILKYLINTALNIYLHLHLIVVASCFQFIGLNINPKSYPWPVVKPATTQIFVILSCSCSIKIYNVEKSEKQQQRLVQVAIRPTTYYSMWELPQSMEASMLMLYLSKTVKLPHFVTPELLFSLLLLPLFIQFN